MLSRYTIDSVVYFEQFSGNLAHIKAGLNTFLALFLVVFKPFCWFKIFLDDISCFKLLHLRWVKFLSIIFTQLYLICELSERLFLGFLNLPYTFKLIWVLIKMLLPIYFDLDLKTRWSWISKNYVRPNFCHAEKYPRYIPQARNSTLQTIQLRQYVRRLALPQHPTKLQRKEGMENFKYTTSLITKWEVISFATDLNN